MPGPLIGIAAGLALFPAIGALSEPYIESLRQLTFKDLPTRILTVNEYALASRLRFLDPQTARDMAQRLGISQSHFDLLVKMQRQFPSPDVITTLIRRGQLPQQEGFDNLAMQGYADDDISRMMQIQQLIPPVNDLITMAVKGAFTQDEIDQFELHAEFPEEVAEWAEKQGLSREWAMRYWAAHWQLPSPQQVLDMLHRGKVSPSVVDIFLKAADYSRFWRKGMVAISYSPLTRVDTRRLFRDNIISFDQMVQSYRDQGYDEQKAQWLSEWTQVDLTRTKKTELKDLTDGLRSSVITGISSGSFPQAQGEAYLSDLGYDGREIESFVAYAIMVREQRIRLRIIERMGDLYVKGMIEKDEVLTYLYTQGFTDEEIALRLQEWDIERELKTPSAATEKERDLTKAEIIDSFKDGISSEEETRSDLTRMKYDAREVDRLIDMATFDIAKAVQKDEIEFVKNSVLSRRITPEDAFLKLDAIGLRATQRNALVSSWERQVDSSAFDLPLSMVEAMFTRKIRTEGETEEALRKLGANTRDSQDILRLWGAKDAEARARLAASTAKVKGK